MLPDDVLAMGVLSGHLFLATHTCSITFETIKVLHARSFDACTDTYYNQQAFRIKEQPLQCPCCAHLPILPPLSAKQRAILPASDGTNLFLPG